MSANDPGELSEVWEFWIYSELARPKQSPTIAEGAAILEAADAEFATSNETIVASWNKHGIIRFDP